MFMEIVSSHRKSLKFLRTCCGHAAAAYLLKNTSNGRTFWEPTPVCELGNLDQTGLMGLQGSRQASFGVKLPKASCKALSTDRSRNHHNLPGPGPTI